MPLYWVSRQIASPSPSPPSLALSPRPQIRMAAAAAAGSSVPPVPMDGSQDSREALFGRILSYIHRIIPGPPASRHVPGLFALLPHDDVDRLSLLPDTLLCNIVCRLPVKDAARTTALSRRWLGVWHSSPLVLVDSHLLPTGTGGGGEVARTDARRVTTAIYRILAAHPGPFRCAHLTTTYMGDFRGLLASWLQLLTVKGIQELVLVNRPSPLDLDLPAGLFAMATLTHLFLGLWKFPAMDGLPQAASFPNLRELGLCSVVMESRHMDFILARTPVLEILCLQGNSIMDRLTLVSRSLRCVQMIAASNLEITVADAPHLERLIIWLAMSTTGKSSCKKIKIGCAPALNILGYLEPEVHTLQIGNTVIKPGTRAGPSTTVPSIKILGLKVCFGIRNEAKMLPCILRCFPNVERLHIQSKGTTETAGKLNLKFWEESGVAECIHSSIKLMIFQNFRGDRNELCFLKFFLQSAQMLTKLVIVYGRGWFPSMEEANSRVKPLFDIKWASNRCSVLLFQSAFTEDEGIEMLNFERGNFSVRDPFALIVRA